MGNYTFSTRWKKERFPVSLIGYAGRSPRSAALCGPGSGPIGSGAGGNWWSCLLFMGPLRPIQLRKGSSVTGTAGPTGKAIAALAAGPVAGKSSAAYHVSGTTAARRVVLIGWWWCKGIDWWDKERTLLWRFIVIKFKAPVFQFKITFVVQQSGILDLGFHPCFSRKIHHT